MRVRHPSALAAQRSHVDNLAFDSVGRLRSRPLPPHPLQRLPRNQERPARIRCEHRVPLFYAQALEVHVFIIGGIIDQDVDAAEFPPRFFHHRFHAGFVRDVAVKGERPHAEARKINHRALRFSR